MPKETFNHLPEEKKRKIISVLKSVFASKFIEEVSVKEIVDSLDIARGSFYQYFEDLYDEYFMILDEETLDIHEMFLRLLAQTNDDVLSALEEYKTHLVATLSSEETYCLYKNRFLCWTNSLDEKWREYKSKKVKKK